jgi:hypothetical protein
MIRFAAIQKTKLAIFNGIENRQTGCFAGFGWTDDRDFCGNERFGWWLTDIMQWIFYKFIPSFIIR